MYSSGQMSVKSNVFHHRKGGYRLALAYWHHANVQLFTTVYTLASLSGR